MRKKLTDRQREVYEFLANFIAEAGYPPSLREMMAPLHITSTNGIRSVLTALEKKGYIQRDPKASRGIKLTDYKEKGVATRRYSDIPILGRVAAGEPILAAENLEGTLALDTSFTPPDAAFALAVSGDSMVQAGIFDGDYVFARQQASAESGDIVVAVIGEEATVKRYAEDRGTVRLMPENPSHDPVVVDPQNGDFRIAGKVVALLRRLQ